MSEQINLFKEKEVIKSEDIAKIKEKERLKRLCKVCEENEGQDSMDSNAKGMCEDCQNLYFVEYFEKLDIPNGFRDEKDKYIFYSVTTGLEEVSKDRVLTILERDRIQTCDEFGCFEHCFAITREFADYVIKDLKLIETDGTWENKKIKQDDKSKKVNELKKDLAIKRGEMMIILKEIKELEK